MIGITHGDAKRQLIRLLDKEVLNIKIETVWTNHFIKYIGHNNKNGSWRWVAEMNMPCIKALAKSEYAQSCLIDEKSFFPRYYFREESIVHELIDWLEIRGEVITSIIELS